VETLAAAAEKARGSFREAMDDDFNTPAALATMFELVRATNSARDAGVSEEPLSQAQAILHELASVLGLRLEAAAQEQRDADPFIDLLVEVRAGLRKAKQFELADTVRQRLSDLGVSLEDTSQGTRWKYER
jgi:cysteinyl-tRNA synthetase